MELGDNALTVALFDTFPIRRTWHEGKWFYSVVGCMAPLSGSPTPRRYWSELKSDLLKHEQFDVYAHDVAKLPLPAQDGRRIKTDCADTETMLRLVQSVKSPNAEPFKQWLAQVGAATLTDPTDPALRAEYRQKLETVDDMVHQLVSFRGVVTAAQHQAFTDANYQGLYDNASEDDLRDMRDLIPGDDPRDWMSLTELSLNMFQRTQTGTLIERRDIRGAGAVNQAAYDVGVEVRLTLERLGGTMPEDLPKHKRLSKGDYMPELRDPEQETDEE